ncbi:MAG: amidohydrolase family protein [Promethearchaeia archaeon]
MKKDLGIFDAHLHTIGNFLPSEMSLIEYMDKYNIKKAALTTTNRAASSKVYADKKGNKTDTKGNKVSQAFKKFKRMMPEGQLDHADVKEIVEEVPERFIPFFWFNPNIDDDKKAESYEILKDHFRAGFGGVKIHSGIHLLKIPRDIEELVSFMQDYDKEIPLFIHSTPKVSYFRGVMTKDIAKLAKQFPQLRIILGHAGYAMEYGIDVGLSLKKFENVFFETSCSIPYAIFSLVKMVGSKRILFGSDAPITNPLSLEVNKIHSLPLTDDQKRDIFYNNAEELFS